MFYLSLLQEARQQLYRDLTDKNIAFDIDGECLKLNNNSPNICFHPDPTRTVKGSVTPETWDQFSNYNKLRAEAEMQASQRLREAIFATIQKTANDLEAQRQATEFSYRKRIHETEQTKNELEWQQRNVSLLICRIGFKFSGMYCREITANDVPKTLTKKNEKR